MHLPSATVWSRTLASRRRGNRLDSTHADRLVSSDAGWLSHPRGCPVGGAGATTNSEVADIGDHRFGAERLAKLEVLLDAARFCRCIAAGIDGRG